MKPRSLSCAEVNALLPEHLLDETGPEVGACVDAHLEVCARCAREWDGLGAVQGLLENEPGPTTAELAEARLGLRRSLQDVTVPDTRPWRWRVGLSRAAGFLLTIGLLTPLVEYWSPELEQATGASELRPSWESGLRSVKERLSPWVPSWSPSEWFVEMHDPATDLLDGLPSLHSGFLDEDPRSG